MLTYGLVNTIHIHHNGHGHFVTSSSFAGKVKMYDSINLTPIKELLDHIEVVYSVDSSFSEIEQVFISATQNGNAECGILAIAYTMDIAAENNPTTLVYAPSEIRKYLLTVFTNP